MNIDLNHSGLTNGYIIDFITLNNKNSKGRYSG